MPRASPIFAVPRMQRCANFGSDGRGLDFENLILNILNSYSPWLVAMGFADCSAFNAAKVVASNSPSASPL